MSQIVMLIKTIGDELEMRVESEDPQGDNTEGKQEQRRDKPSGNGGVRRNKKMKREKERRKKGNGGSHDLDHVVGIHQPIFLLSRNTVTDTVIFKCAQPFVVDVECDEEFLDPNEHDDPTRSPFGWAIPQTSVLQNAGPFSGFHIVTGVFADPVVNGFIRPSDYLFYKATVWSDNLKLDPDFFCDR